MKLVLQLTEKRGKRGKAPLHDDMSFTAIATFYQFGWGSKLLKYFNLICVRREPLRLFAIEKRQPDLGIAKPPSVPRRLASI